jgi:ketosteroid isomerase-like protein
MRIGVTLSLGLTLAFTAAATFTTAQSTQPRCSGEDWRRFEQLYARAQDAFQRGDAGPIKALWSHADDVTLFGALGGHERGWAAIGSRLSQVARMNTSGAHKGDDVLATIVGADLAVMVRIEHIPNSGAGAGVGAVTHLRVTHAARCESGGWRIVNRHADPLVENQVPKPGLGRYPGPISN